MNELIPTTGADLQSSKRIKALRRLSSKSLPSLTIALIGLTLVALVAVMKFNSLSDAILVVGGEVIAVEPRWNSSTVFRAQETAKVPFRIRNLTSNSVSIVGCQSSCSCIGLVGLPITIPAGGAVTVDLAVAAPRSSAGAPFSATSRLYLDVPSPPVVLKVTTDFVLPPAAP